MGARIQPGIAAPHGFDPKLASFQIHLYLQQIGDFQLAPCRRSHLSGTLWRGAIQKIKTRHCIIRRWDRWFFDDLALRARLQSKATTTIAVGIRHVVAEYRSTLGLFVRCGQQFWQTMTEKDVVPQNQRRRRTSQKLLSQNKSLRQTVGAGLHHIGQADPPLAAIPQACA